MVSPNAAVVSVELRKKDPLVGVAELAARRAAGLHALLYWLRELSKRRSVIIAIDDAQWADADSGRLLSQLLMPNSGFQGLVMIADQGTEVTSPLVDAVLNSLDGADSSVVCGLTLQPLTKPVCAELLEKWARAVDAPLSSEIIADLTRRSGGNPFLLREVLSAYLNHVQQFKLDDEAWLRTARTQGRGSHLRSRFSLLPISMERVLQYLAIADEPLGFHQLQTVSRVLPHELLPLINYLASQGWIRINGSSLDSEMEIAHDRFRDVVLDSMPEDRIYRRHYRIARTLSSESPPPWARVAHHYWKASDSAKRPLAICRPRGVRREPMRLLKRSGIWNVPFIKCRSFRNEQRSALRLQGDCYAASGRSSEAIAVYQRLAKNSENEQESHLLDCLMGEQWIAKGDLGRGFACLQGALNEFGVLTKQRKSWMSTLRLWMDALHMSPSPNQTKSLTGSNEPFNMTECCLNRLGTALVFLDIGLGARLVMALAQASAHRGSEADRATAILRWGAVLALGNRRTRAKSSKWIRSGRRLARDSQNANAIALGQLCTFVWLFAHSRFKRATQHGLMSLSLYRAAELTHQWEYAFIQWTLLVLHWYDGRIRAMCEGTRTLRAQWEKQRDVVWSFWF